MPKAKPMALHTQHATKALRSERAAAELSLAPVSELPAVPPALKTGHAGALTAYRRLITLYSEVIAEVVTAFDLDLLVDYCLLLEQIAEMDIMRGDVIKSLAAAKKAKKGDAIGMWMDRLLAIDQRVERKRGMAHRLRESLYLTPRARAGAAPPRKPAEPERDEMEGLMAEVGNVLRGDHV